jgi:hypothetical protein
MPYLHRRRVTTLHLGLGAAQADLAVGATPPTLPPDVAVPGGVRA